MSTPTHLALGWLVARQVLLARMVPPEYIHTVTSVSMLSSILPDVDTLAVWKIMRHRVNSVFHYPFFWFVGCASALLYYYHTDNRLFYVYAWIVTVNVFLHLFLDTFSLNHGICWLWPFSKKMLNFIRISPSTNLVVLARRTVSHPIMLVELGVILTILYIRIRTGMPIH